MKLQTVWIIEDDTSIRWILNKALEKLNVQVSLFENASEALNEIDNRVPDVMVTDIRMPGISGLDFLVKIKQQQPQIPVIVMTAYSDLQTTVDAF